MSVKPPTLTLPQRDSSLLKKQLQLQQQIHGHSSGETDNNNSSSSGGGGGSGDNTVVNHHSSNIGYGGNNNNNNIATKIVDAAATKGGPNNTVSNGAVAEKSGLGLLSDEAGAKRRKLEGGAGGGKATNSSNNSNNSNGSNRTSHNTNIIAQTPSSLENSFAEQTNQFSQLPIPQTLFTPSLDSGIIPFPPLSSSPMISPGTKLMQWPGNTGPIEPPLSSGSSNGSASSAPYTAISPLAYSGNDYMSAATLGLASLSQYGNIMPNPILKLSPVTPQDPTLSMKALLDAGRSIPFPSSSSSSKPPMDGIVMGTGTPHGDPNLLATAFALKTNNGKIIAGTNPAAMGPSSTTFMPTPPNQLGGAAATMLGGMAIPTTGVVPPTAAAATTNTTTTGGRNNMSGVVMPGMINPSAAPGAIAPIAAAPATSTKTTTTTTLTSANSDSQNPGLRSARVRTSTSMVATAAIPSTTTTTVNSGIPMAQPVLIGPNGKVITDPKLLKRERNRLAAEKYRKKGRDLIADLELKNDDLRKENELLKTKNQDLQELNLQLQLQLQQQQQQIQQYQQQLKQLQPHHQQSSPQQQQTKQ